MKKPKKYRLGIYLSKKGIESHNEILNNIHLLRDHKLSGVSPSKAILYTKPTWKSEPNWVNLFTSILDKELDSIYNCANAAVLLVKCKNRYFIFVFGYGRSIVNLNSIESSFGLRVALNSTIPDKVRSVDVKNVNTVVRHMTVQTSQGSSVENFGIDVDRDILNGVTGRSSDEFLGKTITGSIAVYLTFPLTLENLDELCLVLLKKFKGKKYKEKFSWVDHIREIRIKQIKDKLNTDLINSIRMMKFDKIFLSPPEVVDWEFVDGFTFRRSGELQEDIFIEDILPKSQDAIRERVSLQWLKNKRIYLISRESGQSLYDWSLYNCINYETSGNPSQYLLTAGKWFELDSDYVRTVNCKLAKVKEYKGFSFPKYKQKGEPQYNRSVCKNNKDSCILMDRKNISYGGGRSKIEFCDIIINRKDFVHIKRFRGSSALSHLFMQGANAGQLFLASPEFRRKVNGYLPEDSKFSEPIKASKHEIVFAIISKATEGVREILPFFSKISFLRIHSELKLYGYRVSIAKIKMEDNE